MGTSAGLLAEQLAMIALIGAVKAVRVGVAVIMFSLQTMHTVSDGLLTCGSH